MNSVEQMPANTNDDSSPFKVVSPSLYRNGYSIIPLEYKTKRPILKNWTDKCFQRAEKDDLKAWYNAPHLNIGMTLGKASGIIALDFDEDIDGLHSIIADIAGASPIKKKGARGYTSFFRYNGELSRKWQKDGEMVLELLSDGRQTVLPPSIHPDGLPYVYTTDATLENTSAETLPYLPSDFIERVSALFRKDKAAPSEREHHAELDEVRQALDHVSPENYETWLNVGMALKHEFGDSAFPTWESWTQPYLDSNPRSKRSGSLKYKWGSFDGTGIAIGTVFYYAFQNGYQYTSSFDKTAADFPLDSVLDTLNGWRKNGKPVGVRSGIKAMDNHLKWRRGELTVFTGYPGSGKSEFVDFLVYNHILTNNYKTMLVSFEGSGVASHVDSYINRATGKSFEQRTAEEDNAGFNKIKNNLVFYDYTKGSHNIDDVLAYAAAQKNLDILVIDPFNYLTSHCTDQLYLHVNYVLKSIKSFCKKTGVIAILIAHPRSVKDKTKDGKPTDCSVWDIAGGSGFWNMTDNAIAIRRDDPKANDIIVAIQKVKIQDADHLGSFGMSFNKSLRIYDEIDNLDF